MWRGVTRVAGGVVGIGQLTFDNGKSGHGFLWNGEISYLTNTIRLYPWHIALRGLKSQIWSKA